MKSIVNFLLIISLCGIIASCQKNLENYENIKSSVKYIDNIKPIRNILYNGQSNYIDFLTDCEHTAYFIESKNNPISTQKFKINYDSSNVVIKANNIIINNGQQPSNSIISNFFNSIVNFQIGIQSPIYYDLRIPKIINITQPIIQTQNDLIPFCFYDNFEIQWNADVLNTNGVLVIVKWNGDMLGEETPRDEVVENIDIIDNDNGSAVLSNNIFKDIPEDAIIEINLIRGNVKDLSYSGNIYKIGGATIATLPAILVRDLSHYN